MGRFDGYKSILKEFSEELEKLTRMRNDEIASAKSRFNKSPFIALKDYQDQKKAGVTDPVFHPELLVNRRGIEAWDEPGRS